MFTVLHSSAGAGKTHALVKQYLLLAMHEARPEGYAQVLALTFTNKAAVEMRERVLEYLEALALGKAHEGARADLRTTLLAELGVDEAALQQRSQAMLAHMLHHWGQVAIGTIDAFTQQVVRPFARDLQLDQDLRMTTEEERLRAEAVDLLLEEAGQEPALTSILVATCEQLLDEEKAWQPALPLVQLSKQLTKEDAREHLAALQQVGNERFLEVHARLQQRTRAFTQGMRAVGHEALRSIAQAGLTVQDLAYGKNGIVSYFHKLAAFSKWFECGSNVHKVLESDRWHHAKASPAAIAVIKRLAPEWRRTIEQVEALRDKEMRQFVLDTAILRELLPMASLNAIDLRLERIKREQGVSFFSDLTRKVVGIVQNEPAPFLYERLGERYKHFLIDEFQDTSLMQWHALLPLVENALAGDGRVLLVGDTKQAIYRWRNGEARMFRDFPDVFRKEALSRGAEIERTLRNAHVPAMPLTENYRSARAIIRFNNEVTTVLKAGLEEHERAMYDRHEQQARRGAEGYVEVACFAPEPKPDDGTEADEAEDPAPMALLVQAVQDCLADGFQPGDITVLVRTARQGAQASHHLARQGWQVVSPDGLTLGRSQRVSAVLHVLAWLHQPTDKHAALAVQALAVVHGAALAVDPFPQGASPRDLMHHWRKTYPQAHTRKPLVPLVGHIIRAIGCDPATDVFLMALVNEAHAFTLSAGDDLPGFLEHWERAGHKRAVGGNPGADTIQVMTIHKAKGLQFPVVIIPEAGKAPNGGKGDRIWITPRPPIEGLPVALVSGTKEINALEIPEVQEELRLGKLDQLDVLYVALTRPEQRLYLSVSAKEHGFLAKAIREHLGLVPGGRWTAGNRTNALPHKQPDRPAATMALTSHAGEMEHQPVIRLEAPEDWDPANPDPFRSHGRAVHAVLARVHTANDLAGALAREAPVWGLSPEDCEALARHLGLLLAKPAMEPFFGPRLVVHTESTLLNAQGQAQRPDRVVKDGDLFRVLDIKTGAPAERHKEQVQGYMQLLHEVEGAPVDGYLLYLRNGELVPC